MRTTMDTPIGELTLVADDEGITQVIFPTGESPSVASGSSARAGEHLAQAKRELDEYFAGQRTTFDVPVHASGTEFQRQAWAALVTIPYGETVSYGEQAARLGAPNKARAVGAANGRNPVPIIVPCHRVIGSNGKLTGFAGGIEAKAWLLDHERRVCGESHPAP